jgi:hypothetical protein
VRNQIAGELEASEEVSELQVEHLEIQFDMCCIIKRVYDKFQRHIRFVSNGGLIR